MFFQTHPEDPNRPLIDYDAALVFEPCTLLGTTVGVLCNITFPEWLTVALLIIILSVTTVRTGQKGYQVMKKELSAIFKKKEEPKKKEEAKNQQAENEEEKKLLLEPAPIDESPRPEDNASIQSINDMETLKQIVKEERRTPIGKFLILVACWVIILGLSLLRGGHGAASIIGIQPCSGAYWGIFAISFPIIMSITASVAIYLLWRHKLKTRLGYNFKKGDIVWTVKTVLLYPFYCWIAGIMAALLGIGGGMIKGPLLLELVCVKKTQWNDFNYFFCY